jgi:hypothetical protein
MVKRLVEAQEKVARVHPDPICGAVVQRENDWMAFSKRRFDSSRLHSAHVGQRKTVGTTSRKRGFDSLRAQFRGRRSTVERSRRKRDFEGSTPSDSTCRRGQMERHPHGKRKITGSIPVGGYLENVLVVKRIITQRYER